jgi:tetratricopeptide (TPR) repeat protein
MNDTTQTNDPAGPVAKARANLATYEAAWQDNQRDVTACTNLAWALLVLARERVRLEEGESCSAGGCCGPQAVSPAAAEQFERVLQLTDVVLAQDPESKFAWHYRQSSYLELQRFEACRDVCVRQLAKDPFNKHAQRTLAYCHYYAGNSFESGKAYERAWELEPENAEHLQWAQESYSRAGEEEHALRVAKLGVADFPRNAKFKRYLYHRAMREERYAEALQIAEEQSQLDPEDFAPHVAAGYTLLEIEREADARVAFEEAIRLAPGCGTAYAGLLATLGDEPQEPEVREIFRRVLANCDLAGDDFLAIIHWGGNNGYAELALNLLEKMSAARDVHLRHFESEQAGLLEKLGRHAEAKPLREEAANRSALHLERVLAEIRTFNQGEFARTLGPKVQADTLVYLCRIFQAGNRLDCLEQCLAFLEAIDSDRARSFRTAGDTTDTTTPS